VPEEKLDLLQFTAVNVAQLGTCPAKVVRGKMLQVNSVSTVANDIPDDVLRNSFSPWSSVSAHCPENPTVFDPCCG
jgi:hypothetical protein